MDRRREAHRGAGLLDPAHARRRAVALAVLVAGGFNGSNGPHTLISSSELYNPSTGTWTTTGNLNVGRANATATLLNNDEVLIAGGAGSIGGTVIGTMLVGVLVNGLVLNNVSSYVQQIIIGGIIILAVAFDRLVKERTT